MLPTFFAVGAAKAGTTSLYHYLGDHPGVFVSSVKEPFFFSFMNETPHFQGPYDDAINQDIVTDVTRYRELFEDTSEEKERGEFSNSYLYFHRSANRIREWVPDAKILIMLRDPARRAFSHYLQARMLGHEHLSFEAALSQENERQRQNWRWHYQYRDQSRYAESVRQYLDIFGEKQVRCILFDDFVKDTRRTMKGIAKFLGVDSTFYAGYDFKTYNETKHPKSELVHRLFRGKNILRKAFRLLMPIQLRQWAADLLNEFNYSRDEKPDLRSETELRLRKEFQEDIEKLEDVIQRDLSAWKKKAD
ncbi:hypothetical protein GGQ02_002496 [Salinibacter ruber]|uniref:sulfotransferase family protein n=1 Tax=Salinibacter ruber TaxID=146919 RepID=UPI00216A6F08|nr:sulfotransferase [Salinibacter ruber]MCS4034096.1 hypothetical protein [Salinibacter ruber]